MKRTVDWVVTGTVIASPTVVWEDGAVAVQGNRIVGLGDRGEITAAYEGRPLGGPTCTVMAGMIDCHTHAAQALVRSLIAHEAPMIYRLYLPAEDAMSLDDVALSTQLLMAQLIRSGVTCFAETTATPAHEETVAQAVADAGFRAVLARGAGDQRCHHAAAYSQIGDRSWIEPRSGAAEADLERTAAFLDRYDPRGSGRIKGSVLASHITGYSDTYFRLAAELAAERAATLQVHVARDREEVEFCLAVHGCRPVEHLAGLGVLSPRTLAIHAILLTAREIELLAAGGSAVAHSPVECQNILNGVPPVRTLRDRGIAVGLGCDNAINDMWEVMRTAWTLHSGLRGIRDYDAEHLPAEDIFAMATLDAARAVGWSDAIGSLEVDKRADLVVVDRSAPHLCVMQHPLVDLVRYGTRADVRDVMIDGRLVLSGGELTTIDLEAVTARAAEAAPRIATAVSPRRYRPLSPTVEIR